MKVRVVKPYGFCSGVSRAILLAHKAKEEHPEKKIYLLGMIVHNEKVISSLQDEGFVILDERKDSLANLLESIPEEQVVVFSAHGHDEKLDDLARRRKLIAYDATCPFVLANVNEARRSKEEVIYIGVHDHLESQAFLANCPTASFYDVKSNIFDDHCVSPSPLVIAQTTLGEEEYDRAIFAIKAAHKNAKEGKERCPSTKERQQSVYDIPSSIKEVVVLGSSTSNNSKKLYEIAVEKGHKAHLCLGLDEVKKLKLEGKEVALSSGASTAPDDFDKVREYLETLS
ncbi:MAG: hypothetical protein MJ239_03615 [Bacilli bacterium]|nr:hypothetical protein [Bacilli bacterium]